MLSKVHDMWLHHWQYSIARPLSIAWRHSVLGGLRLRVRSYAVHISRQGEQMTTAEERIVRCLPPHDGKPRLRPHTIKGWWQVWSGGICIALLEPEDIQAAGLALVRR